MKKIPYATRLLSLSAALALSACGGGTDNNPGPLPENTPPSVAMPGAISVPENSTFVTDLAISDAEGNPITINTTGPDADAFSVSESGEVRFAVVADFENPLDADVNNVYEIVITVDDSYTMPVEVPLEVTVTDLPPDQDIEKNYTPVAVTTATDGLSTDESTFDPERLISSFEEPLRLLDATSQVFVTGVFADSGIAANGWSNFNGQADAAYVGNSGVSTCEIDGQSGNCDAPVGTLKITKVEIKDNYLQFLMSGGNGGNSVGMEVLYRGAATDNEEVVLGIYTPNACGDPYVRGDQHWVHFDTSDLIGEQVSLFIYDNESAGCGFVAFDHVYQTSEARGTFAGKLNKPALAGVDSDGDGVDDVDDAFPNDPSESADSDSDGVGDNADQFPQDATESVDTDGDGVGDNSDAFPEDSSIAIKAVNLDLPVDGALQQNIVASFDDPLALQADTDRYVVTGVFADPAVAEAGWDNFDAAYIGGSAVSTCEIGATPGNCDAPVGSITIKDVEITGDYLNFLMAGGNGSVPVGVRILAAGSDQELGSYMPATCGVTPPWISSNDDWSHFDVSALRGQSVDIVIFDEEAGGCGFLAFDHFFQSDIEIGSFVGAAAAPGVDSDGDGVSDAQDDFPNDPTETRDSDGDGVGDNADAFPEDPTETVDTDGDGVGDNADSDPEDPNVTLAVVNVTLNPEGGLAENVIADFDDPLAIQADSDKFELTGVFADSGIAMGGWNDLATRDDAARIGAAAVTTCEIGEGGCDAPMGTILIKGVEVQSRHINFMMSGGNGGNNVGVRILLPGEGEEDPSELANYTPNFCGNPIIASDEHWAHFDVTDLIGRSVDILIYDNEEAGCGFLSFDHFYQGSEAIGANVGVVSAPLESVNVTVDPENYGLGLIPGGSFENPELMLSEGGWEATGDFAGGSADSWVGTTRFDTAARIGQRAVSTCEMNDNAAGCDAPVGTLMTPAFRVSRDYLQFLMAGGNGDAPVGVEVLDTIGTGLARYQPNSCGPANIDGDDDWTFFDVSMVRGAFVRVRFFDEEPGGCGFVSFDHIYETDALHLPDAAIAAGQVLPVATLGYNVTVTEDSFVDVIGDFNDALEMLNNGWTATGAFESPADADAWTGTTRFPEAAHVGARAVSTCEINANGEGCDAPTGTLTSPAFMVSAERPYLNLLLGGGNGDAPVGIRVLGDGDAVITEAKANSCGPAFVDGDDDWTSIDLSANAGSMVQVQLFDEEPGGCGFLSFDHVHMGASPR